MKCTNIDEVRKSPLPCAITLNWKACSFFSQWVLIECIQFCNYNLSEWMVNGNVLSWKWNCGKNVLILRFTNVFHVSLIFFYDSIKHVWFKSLISIRNAVSSHQMYLNTRFTKYVHVCPISPQLPHQSTALFKNYFISIFYIFKLLFFLSFFIFILIMAANVAH